MKVKKLSLTIIAFILVLLTFATVSLGVSHIGVYGIKMIREGGYGYKMSGSIIWKVVKYTGVEMEDGNKPKKNTGTIDWSKSVYCLKAGLGFGSAQDTVPVVEQDRVYYPNESIMEPIAISGAGSSLFRMLGSSMESVNHNAVVWLLDHIYLPKHPNATERKMMRDDLLTKAFAEKMVEEGITLEDIQITDDQMEAIFQLAVWYFTNSDDVKYHIEELASIQETQDAEGRQTDAVDQYVQEDLNTLYQYLIKAAKAAAPLYGTTRTTPTIVRDESVSASIEKATNGVIVGPIKVNITGLDNIYNLKINVDAKVGDQSVSPTCVVLQSDKKTPVTNMADINGKEIYISLNNSNISSLSINVTGSYAETTITKLTADEDDQPIAVVEREFKPINVNINIKPFDLALRKFISKVNDKNVTPSREPQVDVTKLADETSKTATYTHPKNAVTVSNGDLVTYTLRVYNEGSVSGYAEEIMDTIPEGLEFVPTDKTNQKYGWKMYKKEGNELVEALDEKEATVIKTDYLSIGKGKEENLIKAFDKTTKELSYKDVQLVFKVVEPNSSTRVLKNIAEITLDKDEEGNDITDRDSQPNNVNPDTYPQDKNVQDDDDYEKLVLNEFDLALRKFITEVNDKKIETREPEVDVTELKDKTSQNAKYTHPKDPVGVQKGDIVIYTIRVYNEGNVSGYAEEITDNIPRGLEFVIDDPTNIEYMWKLSEDGSKITTKYLSREKSESNLILGFNSETMNSLHYKEVKVAFKVVEPNTSEEVLINIAEISDDRDENGNEIDDRDSVPDNGVETEDDIDKEYLKLEYFDLALRKFVSKVNGREITPSREPQVDVSKIKNGSSTTATYTQPKNKVSVMKNYNVVYTIRVYNEGKIAGYAEEITDILPEGLEFVPAEESAVNKKYGWVLSEDGKTVSTNYLSEANSNSSSTNKEENFLIEGFGNTDETLDYRDVQIECKVVADQVSGNNLRNIAEVTKDAGEDGKEVTDIDSTPDNVDEDNYNPPADNSKYQEDDDDYEDLVPQIFDLSLRKFITQINDEAVDTRVPDVSLSEDGKLEYNHSKEPLYVVNNDTVIYTIRVYNEGEKAGYASEISDDIPDGLVFLPNHDINKQYGWVLSEDGKTVSTDYLSKEKSEERNEDNLLKAFDRAKDISAEKPYNPDYRDVKIAFRITETNLPSSRMIINTAEITDDQDEYGDPVEDNDSVPKNGEENEDDLDKEYLKVKYFDLSLLKWVSKVYQTENGKTTVTNTGHTGEENPEPIVKVDLHRKKLNSVTVKFGYVIKITNEGEIAGYATEISDYIPDGLKFDKADNPDWEEKDGKIVTRALENKRLEPGESAEVEVILTWINDEDNVGVMTNIAEISEDKNDYGAKDIDSTPNNKKDGEDDIDDAPVMLAVATGGVDIIFTYFPLVVVVLAILGSGIYAIKKYVL